MIVTCGEALVDLMPETIGGEVLYRPVLGGSLYTAALGIARLGGKAGYLWELSSDALGARLVETLGQANVDVGAVRRSARATPVAVVDLSGEEARYNIADPDGVMVDTDLGALPNGTACLLIGSAVLAREPVASAIERLAADAPLLAVDYNVRPPSIVDRPAYKARLARLSRRAAIVKASVADLTALGEDDPRAFMAELARAGTSLAVLTAAQDGAHAFTSGVNATRTGARATAIGPQSAGRGVEVSVPSAVRTIVDTVGAGDAFMVGLLYHLQRIRALSHERLAGLSEGELLEALRFAQAAAAFTCASKGAHMPSSADLAAKT